MPNCFATDLAVVSPSPVAITTLMRASFNAVNADGVVDLIGSVTTSKPASFPATAKCTTLAPVRRALSASRASAMTSTPSCCISAALPSASRFPSTTPCTPLPVADSNCAGFDNVRPFSRAAATIAAANGCSLPWSRLAASCSTSFAAKPLAAMTLSKAGCPAVRVPVLSTINVSTFRKFSMAAASRNKTPCVAPRPVATMIDIGVARPSAHGQAMMSTATAFIKPYTQLGSGPNNPHATKVSNAMLTTVTTK